MAASSSSAACSPTTARATPTWASRVSCPAATSIPRSVPSTARCASTSTRAASCLRTSMGDWDEALDVLVQPNGKILIGGYTIHSGVFRGALLRLQSSGVIETQFGLVNTDSIEKAAGIALQADGKVIAVGRGISDFGIARFTSSGAVDASFGSDGKLLV